MREINPALLKQLIIKALLDSDFRNNLFKIIFFIILIAFIIITFIGSLPSIVLSGVFDEVDEDLEKIYFYQNAIIAINTANEKWIERKKKETSYDDIEIRNDSNLTWYELIAIDSILLGQDFSNINTNKIQELAEKFITRKSEIIDYKEEIEYEEEETFIVKENYTIVVPYTVIKKVPKIVEKEKVIEYQEWVPWISFFPSLGGRYVTKTKIEIVKVEEIVEEKIVEYRKEEREREVEEKRIVIKTKIEDKKKLILTINSKTLEEGLKIANITEEEDILLAENIYDTMLEMDIEGLLNIYDEDLDFANLKEYPEGNANIPYYNQTDKRWANIMYGKSSSIGKAGCGPTSLAMVVAGLTSNKVTPLDVANWSVKNGHRAEGNGSYWSLMTAGGKFYGLNVETVSRKNPNKIKETLSKNIPIIAIMRKGHFTNGGHFIVLRGITKNGKVLVYDPNSIKRSNQEWDLSIIMSESSKNGGESGKPFWIFKIEK